MGYTATDQDKTDIERRLREAGGGLFDPSDLEGVLRNIGYDNGAQSIDQAIQHQSDIYGMRRDSQTTGSRDQDGDGIGDLGGGSQQNKYPRDGGVAVTQQQLDELMSAIQGMNAQPDVDLSNIGPGDFPVFEVPGENLSPAIDDTLLDMMEGFDPLNTESYLKDLLDRTAGGGIDSQRLQTRREMARNNLDRGLETTMEQMRAMLADRGLISMPGAPQGPELESTERWSLPLQQTFLQELRTSELDEQDRADEAERDALTRATGWTRDQVDSRMAGARTAQERQQMMASISLGVLDRNIEWNKFLAEFGLKREQIAEEMRQGRFQNVQGLMQSFLALMNASRGGFI